MMGDDLRPKYYRDQQGHDLFWRFEHNQYPAFLSIGFCDLNVDKYRQRLGKKTVDQTQDRQKIATYQAEKQKLIKLYEAGKIDNRDLVQWVASLIDESGGYR